MAEKSLLMSKGFWGVNLINVVFNDVSYNSETGTYITDVNYAATEYKKIQVEAMISALGGTIMISQDQACRFIINRSKITEAFKTDIVDTARQFNSIRRRIMFLNSADMNTLENAGGTISINGATLANKLKDKQLI